VYFVGVSAWLYYICAFFVIVPAFYETHHFALLVGPLPVLLFTIFFCSNARVRALVHAWLASRGQGVSAAAGVAALIDRQRGPSGYHCRGAATPARGLLRSSRERRVLELRPLGSLDEHGQSRRARLDRCICLAQLV